MIDQLLERFDLSAPFGIAVFAGAILAVFLAQISWERELNYGDPSWLRNIRRAGLLLQALSFIWALQYGFEHQWQPWPPFLLIVAVLDLNMIVRIMTIYERGARKNSRPKTASLAR